MSLENWKLENDLCRCCHSEGSFKNLAEPFKITDLAEIYADMLKECYGIDMVPVAGMLSAVTYTICEVCIIRLRDASDFKKQVLLCEERFKDMYNRHAINAAGISSIEIEVKQEIPDSEPDDDFKEEFSQDDNDDGDNDSMDMKIDEEDEEPVKVEVRKKRKYKTRATVKSAAAKNKKRTKAKNLKEEPADADSEEEAEKKKDRAVAPFLSDGQVVKPTFVLRDEDYKKEGDSYTCAKCENSYKTKHSLKNHLKMKHYKIPRYKCSICTETFLTLAPLAVHKLKVHNVDDRYQCNACNNMFNTKRQLTNHINIFHMLGEDGRRYKCELCDYETIKAPAMYRHKFMHKTVKDQHCRFCKKSFKRRSTLNFHEKIHTGDRRKVCTECGQAFVQKASLNYHMTKYHPQVNF